MVAARGTRSETESLISRDESVPSSSLSGNGLCGVVNHSLGGPVNVGSHTFGVKPNDQAPGRDIERQDRRGI
jgi:hypothetical protein